jgi:hypothetical protein
LGKLPKRSKIHDTSVTKAGVRRNILPGLLSDGCETKFYAGFAFHFEAPEKP